MKLAFCYTTHRLQNMCTIMSLPNESEIKSITLNYLKEKGYFVEDGVIINEFVVGGHSRRVDLALVYEDRSLAFEIKSDADSLVRLQGQVATYTDYFDKVIVVTAQKHTDKVLVMTPNDVAVWEVRGSKIVIKRRGRIRQVNCKKTFVKMMTVSELKKLRNLYKLKAESNKRRTLEPIVLELPLSIIRLWSLKAIVERYKLRTNKFLEVIHDRNVIPEDLFYLRTEKKMSFKSRQDENIDHFLEILDSL